MIEFNHINKYYGTHHVLRDITMTVSRGEVRSSRGERTVIGGATRFACGGDWAKRDVAVAVIQLPA